MSGFGSHEEAEHGLGDGSSDLASANVAFARSPDRGTQAPGMQQSVGNGWGLPSTPPNFLLDTPVAQAWYGTGGWNG